MIFVKKKTVWCYLDGKKHCDVIEWALGANVDITEAKKILIDSYPYLSVTFKVK
jgi:hypothetical protein